MINRFLRLLQPSTALILALAITGSNLGFTYALNAYEQQIRRNYDVPAEEWQKFTGAVRSLQWDVGLTVAVFTALGIVLAPASNRNQREAIRLLARQKLSQDVLTEAELMQWTALLREVEKDA